MTLYVCTQRLKTADGIIHDVGSTVNLTGEQEQSAVRQQAVRPAPVGSILGVPSLDELQQERAEIDHQIATMEHDGGAAL